MKISISGLYMFMNVEIYICVRELSMYCPKKIEFLLQEEILLLDTSDDDVTSFSENVACMFESTAYNHLPP